MSGGAKTELAEERTDFAEDRTVLANERTLAGWMRTGLASVGIGIGFNALFDAMQPAWIPKAIATAFLLLGIMIWVLAERRSRSVLARLNVHAVEPVGSFNLRLMTYAMASATGALIAALWLVRIE
jgi:putative membrane protein